jgi:hypothetical protein
MPTIADNQCSRKKCNDPAYRIVTIRYDDNECSPKNCNASAQRLVTLRYDG